MVSFNESDGVWRTIGGRKVFIRDGESIPDAMKRSGKFKTTKEQKKAGIKPKESDFDKNIEDMNEDELRDHLNKLESGMDDFDEDEPQFKQLQKEYNEVKKQLDSKSKESDKSEKKKKDIMNMDPNEFQKEAELEKRVAVEKEKFRKEKESEKNSESEKSYTQKDLDNAKAKMLDMEGTLDDFENDDDLRGSKAHKDAIKEYKQAKAEYDKLSKQSQESEPKKFNSDYIKDWEDRMSKAKTPEERKQLVSEWNDSKGESYQDRRIREAKNDNERELANKSKELNQKQNEINTKRADLYSGYEGNAEKFLKGDDLKEYKKLSNDYENVRKDLRKVDNEYNKSHSGTSNNVEESLRNFKEKSDVKQQELGNRIMGKSNGNENLKTRVDDDFESVSKQLKEISSRTGRSDLMSEAGRKWDELYKQNENNVSKDLGGGYKIGVGYDGTVHMNSSHPYDDTDYSFATKKDGKWEVRNPMTKTSKTVNTRDEALSEMKKIDKQIQGGEKVRDNEGVSRYKDTPYKSAYEDYKKKHPNSKISFNQFVDMSEGK